MKQELEELKLICEEKEPLKEQFKQHLNEARENLETCEEYCTYLWMLARWYEEKGNKNAATYCCLRINEVKSMYAIKPGKRRLSLTFNEFEMCDAMEQFVDVKTSFMIEKNEKIKNKLLIVSILTGGIVFLILRYLLSMTMFFALFQWLAFAFLTYFFSIRRSKEHFYVLQSNACFEYLDEEDKQFDQQYL